MPNGGICMKKSVNKLESRVRGNDELKHIGYLHNYLIGSTKKQTRPLSVV